MYDFVAVITGYLLKLHSAVQLIPSIKSLEMDFTLIDVALCDFSAEGCK